ncbi:MAG: DUF5979 domain-containing protein [Actinobacteria bacterium]|nr:DUF5979 domain-containing protein [Actinomycetota bacterium]MCL6088533.1 DUF5979 domain-containing protein [Actinomycetota bacterium]
MKKVLKRFFYILSIIFVISGMLLLIPGTLFAGTEDGPVTLKTQHIGLAWDDPEFGHEAPPAGVTVNAGQYMWHLVLSPTLNIATTDADLVLFSGDTLAKKEQNGASIHFYIVNTNPNAQAWVANVTDGLEYNNDGSLKTELRVSHTWYGGTTPENAGIIINKSILGGNPATGTFTFNVYAAASGGDPINAAPLSITITNGTSGTTTFTSASLTAGTTYYVEELPTSGFTANTANRVAVVAAVSPGAENTATFENTPTTPGTGSITVTKNVAGGLTDGVFTFSISKVGDSTWKYGGPAVVITYPGNTGNKTFTDLDLDATYLITESSSGTNIAFTATSDPANG